jgi:membrane associated rhomboid family serine protease
MLGFAFYMMTAEERARAAVAAAAFLEGDPRGDAFIKRLRERTSWTLVTPAIIALNAVVLILVSFGSAASPEHVLSWGGNFGPRTTNGEWWRLITSMFVHTGMLHLIANTAGLLQLGLVVERFVGPLALVSVYFAAGILGSLTSVSQDPLSVGTGASAAIFGIYGLFASAAVWAQLAGSTLQVSLETLKRLAPAAGIFLVWNLASGALSFRSELTGLLVGLISGAVLTRPIAYYKPSARRIATTAAAALTIAIAAAIPLRGFDDVRPEIKAVIAVEERTASEYESALGRFQKGRLSAESLVQLIERTIVPELQAADARLSAVDKVTPAHQPMVASIKEYLRLRHESWRLRAEGLRKMVNPTAPAQGTLGETVTMTLMQAERTERDSLASLQKTRTDLTAE